MLDGIPLISLTPSAILGIVVLMLVTDRLVTGRARDRELREQQRHHDLVIEMKDAEIAHLRTSDQVRSAQVTKLLETQDLGLAVATSIQREAKVARQETTRGEHA